MPPVAPSPPVFERRLAAIAFADVAGFSGRIAADDVGTVNEWKGARLGVIEPSILAHGGRLLRVVGDGLLVEFRSAIDAVRWAIDVQKAIDAQQAASGARIFAMRIGINVDDVLVDEGEVHGDGVNVAARIHAMAAPGEVVVTAAVRDYVQNRIDARFEDLGEHRLKHISHPVRIARLVFAGSPVAAMEATDEKPAHVRSPLRLPAVAVVPLRSAATLEADDEVCEGLIEEVIGALSRTRSFFIVARTIPLRDSAGQNVVMNAARDLGARYLVLCSVRRSGALLRIAAKLVDATAELTLWADRYDGALDDLFNFQEWAVARIVATIEPSIANAERARAQTRPLETLDAHDCVMCAAALLQRLDYPRWDEAAALLQRAISGDPFHARSHAQMAWLHLLIVSEALSGDIAADIGRARELADKAVLLEPEDPFVLSTAGHVYSLLLRQPQRGLGFVRRAIELDDASALAWGVGALAHSNLSESAAALAHFERAHALMPAGPFSPLFVAAASMAELVQGRFADAARWAREALQCNPRFVSAHLQLISALANDDRIGEARASARELLGIRPGFRIASLAEWHPLRPKENLDLYLSGLRAAGLPD